MEDSLELRKMPIPEHPLRDNYVMMNGKVEISGSDSLIHGSMKMTIGGDYSTSSRHLWIFLDSLQKKKGVQMEVTNKVFRDVGIDSLSLYSNSNVYPYPFKVSYNISVANNSVRIEDAVYNLPMQGIIKNLSREVLTENRILDLYYPYAFSADYNIMLSFDHPVEILNIDKFNIQEDSDIASFSSSMKRINDKAFILATKYTLKVPVIKKDKFPLLINVDKASESITQISLLYKITGE
jgi:hypothetical protein